MKTGRRDVLALALGLGLALAIGCEKLDTPADPVWGKEPCAHCRMLVGDRRFAAQAVASGDRLYFDDIGCFVLWAKEHPPARAWVRDAEHERWLEASGARYASGARTPMDFGFEGRVEGSATVGFEEMRASVLGRANAEKTGKAGTAEKGERSER